MEFNEKVNKTLDNRINALISLKGTLQSIVDANDEIDFNNKYLFGDGTNEGIVNFLEVYYRELYLGIGRTTSAPALQNGLNTSKSLYLARFINAVDLSGDDATGFYPPNAYGIGSDTLNTSSIWFTTHGDSGVNNGGIVGNSYSVATYIGTSADSSDGKGSYASEAEAEAAVDSFAGTGLLGKRTENSEVYETFLESGVWKIGKDGIDYPDYFDTTERTNLLNSLSTVITNTTNYSSYLDTMKAMLQKIVDGNNELVEETNSAADFPTSDIANINSLQSTLAGYISDLQAQYDYFESFSPNTDISGQAGYVRSKFNLALLIGIPSILSNIISALQARDTQVKTNISYNNISSGIRKWFYFWISENINKPISPYTTLDGVGSAITQINKIITQVDNALEILFNDPTKYISTPESLSAYLETVLDLNNDPVSESIKYLWLGNSASNKYKIFKKDVTNDIPDNSAWTDDYLLDWIIELNPENLSIYTEYTDTSLETDKIFAYRVQAFDTNESPASEQDRLDSFNSSSEQSNLFSTSGFSIVSIANGIITTSVEHNISNDSFIALLGSASNDGYYHVSAVSTTSLKIDDESFTESSGTIYQAFGFIRLT